MQNFRKHKSEINNEAMSEIVIYQSNELAEHIEVRINEKAETIWLTQRQMAVLFAI